MAIVHPAFCVVDIDSMEPFARRRLTISIAAAVDTNHFKNRVYSSGTADVFSALINAARTIKKIDREQP
ncbi:hypothetical protein [Pseudomonas sp. F01002]|uniref:hypothetical protein n=1 Tax=Pseudomonas sp. F01002 TaxID=2555724 RepID=UPI00106BA543|nr:hypothetical protein [Pseudomonas sp. F01002]TFB35110.1 hypothetical protein E3W21_27355 [Pseudomonas sp. F01002]